MFKDVLMLLIRRSLFVVVLLQGGLVLSIYALATLAQNESIYGTSLWYSLLGGVILLYGGIMLGVFYLLWPIYSVYRKIQNLLRWRDWILTELPKIIALMPSLIQALRDGFEVNKSSNPSSNKPHTPPAE